MAFKFEPPQSQSLLNFEVDQHLGCQSELLNKVWGLAGCPSKGQLMLMNRSVRSCFCGATVLLASSGDQVSFNTTACGNGVVLLKDMQRPYRMACCSREICDTVGLGWPYLNFVDTFTKRFSVVLSNEKSCT